MTAQALEKGAKETVRAASLPSPWQKSEGSWTLPIRSQLGVSRPGTVSTGQAGAAATSPSPARCHYQRRTHPHRVSHEPPPSWQGVSQLDSERTT